MANSMLAKKSSLILLALSLSCALARADDDEGHSWWIFGDEHRSTSPGLRDSGTPAQSAAYRKECGSCHMAYPPGLLPAGSWQHLMNNLHSHFGADASLDVSTANAISSYLVSHAGSYKRVSEMPAQDRISQSSWFTRKHDRHVNASVWNRPAIGSRANCVACHNGAEQGNFNEHTVRIPA